MANRYRFGWKTDSIGWNYRLDILPYDATLSDAITNLDAGIVIAIDPMTQAFDELPIGLQDATTMSVTLNYSRCPSALQTVLRNKVNGSDRTMFLFWSDRGTAGGTYTLEFCGTFDNIESTEYVPNDVGEYEIKYELVDCLHYTMSTLSGSTALAAATLPESLTAYERVYEVEYRDGLGIALEGGIHSLSSPFAAYRICASSWSWCMDILNGRLSTRISSNLARTTNTSDAATLESADYTDAFDAFVEIGIQFYPSDYQQARGKGATALNADNLYLTTHVYASDGALIGGLFSPLDEYGWAQSSAILDLFRDFCETFGVKATYYPEYVADAGGDYIRYTWNITAPADGTYGVGSPPTVQLTKCLEHPTINEGGSAIGKAEVRYDLSSARYNYDITEYIATNERSRSTRSWNTEPIIHNVPSYKPIIAAGGDGAREYGGKFYQTNLVYDISTGIIAKAHEATRYNLSWTNSVYYDTSFTEQLPTNLGSRGDLLADNETQNARLTAFLNAAQQQCSPVALAEGVLQAFGSEFQTTLECTYPLTYSSNVHPSQFGRRHSLSGGPQSVLTHIPWDKAIVTEMETDWTAGTIKVTYLLVDL